MSERVGLVEDQDHHSVKLKTDVWCANVEDALENHADAHGIETAIVVFWDTMMGTKFESFWFDKNNKNEEYSIDEIADIAEGMIEICQRSPRSRTTIINIAMFHVWLDLV